MKLRNKKTGEIGELQITEKHCAVSVGNGTASCGIEIYSSLAELNAEWEDAPEEPKKYWYMDYGGRIKAINDANDEEDVARKEIGNYFDTREEAEKAVEKLKAWKRLKDKGFRFKRWTIPEEPKTPHIKLVIEAEMDVPDSPYDLDLLFGGE